MPSNICFICDTESRTSQSNIIGLKSQHSDTEIIEFIKKFLGDYPPRRIIGDETNTLCTECIIRINDYDLACETAKHIEQELHDILIQTETNKQTVKKPKGKRPMRNKGIVKSYIGMDDEGNEDVQIINDSVQQEKRIKKPENLKLSCKKCNVTFQSIAELAAHKHDGTQVLDLVSHNNGETVVEMVRPWEKASFERYLCIDCKQTFNKKVELIKHMKVHKSESRKIKITSKFKCKLCWLALKSKEELTDHCKLHENRSQFECVICNTDHITKYALMRHMVSHTGVASFQCHRCGKLFPYSSSLDGHMRSHDDVRTKKCTECNKLFRSTSHLNRHKRVHIGDKPFKCELCDRAFAYKENLNSHVKVHSGSGTDKVHLCSFCGQGYSRKHKLKLHLMKNHGTVLPHTTVENDLISLNE